MDIWRFNRSLFHGIYISSLIDPLTMECTYRPLIDPFTTEWICGDLIDPYTPENIYRPLINLSP